MGTSPVGIHSERVSLLGEGGTVLSKNVKVIAFRLPQLLEPFVAAYGDVGLEVKLKAQDRREGPVHLHGSGDDLPVKACKEVAVSIGGDHGGVGDLSYPLGIDLSLLV